VARTIHDLFGFPDEGSQVAIQSDETEEVSPFDEIFFSVMFTGEVYGEFLIGLSRRAALEMIGVSVESELASGKSILDLYLKNRDEVLDTFREVVNLSAGQTMRKMKERFPDITMTPPRSIEGRLTLPAVKLARVRIQHQVGLLNCYIYVDQMRLDIADRLQQEQLKQAELKRLSQAKTEFLANMSHELRTPLNGMIGMLDLLQLSDLTEAQKQQISVIHKSGDFLLNIISDILEFSKIEAGKLVVESRPFSMEACLESVAETLGSEVFKRGLEFLVWIDPKLSLQVLGDETRLKQVCMNLLGNAIKFTPTGEIEFRAEVIEGRIAISVRDTGVGIPKGKLESIFDSFSQVDVSDTRRYGGSGLGLTISRSIVQALGGKVSVESTEAVGTCFRVDLPLVHAEQATEPEPNPTSKAFEGKTQMVSEPAEVHASTRSLDVVLRAYLSTLGPGAERAVVMDDRVWRRWSEEKRLGKRRLWENEKIRDILLLVTPGDISDFSSRAASFAGFRVEPVLLPVTRTRLRGVLEKLARRERGAQSEATLTARAGLKSPDQGQAGILLVEDNAINETVAVAMLKRLGWQVEVARNGREAVERFRQGRFHLVLMDCQMPIMDGYEATRQIRQIEQGESLERTPVMAMTANAFRETKERCFECGMDDFLTKPIKLDGLSMAIEKLLSERVRA
jgi:signal transduction histidine kinase/ActR/RegA family two-component response regulator